MEDQIEAAELDAAELERLLVKLERDQYGTTARLLRGHIKAIEAECVEHEEARMEAEGTWPEWAAKLFTFMRERCDYQPDDDVDLYEDITTHILEIECDATKLQNFKNYVHKRLDEAGIPGYPNGLHSTHGCRVGDRLDIAFKHLPAEDQPGKDAKDVG